MTFWKRQKKKNTKTYETEKGSVVSMGWGRNEYMEHRGFLGPGEFTL